MLLISDLARAGEAHGSSHQPGPGKGGVEAHRVVRCRRVCNQDPWPRRCHVSDQGRVGGGSAHDNPVCPCCRRPRSRVAGGAAGADPQSADGARGDEDVPRVVRAVTEGREGLPVDRGASRGGPRVLDRKGPGHGLARRRSGGSRDGRDGVGGRDAGDRHRRRDAGVVCRVHVIGRRDLDDQVPRGGSGGPGARETERAAARSRVERTDGPRCDDLDP